MHKFYLFFLLFASCSATKPIVHSELHTEETDLEIEKDSVADVYNVQFTAHQYIPYCGGAAPSEDQINQYAILHGGFLLIDLQTNEKSQLRANNDGLFQLNLPPGKYCIKEEFKDVPFDEFVQQHKKSGMYLMTGSDECYQKWWSSYLGEFEIVEGEETLYFEYHIGSRCFIGKNPCATYTGPYPP